MIDFFSKRGSMTKRVSGIAKLKGVPKVGVRPPRKVARIGTFYDAKEKVSSVLLEVADTDETRARGLMNREDVTDVNGMLFEGLSGGGSFWMKDCVVPLDVAFMDKGGRITKMYSMPVDKSGSKRYAYDDADVSAVELPEGYLKRHGIQRGFTFETRALENGEASDG